jgi:hypothetical protein
MKGFGSSGSFAFSALPTVYFPLSGEPGVNFLPAFFLLTDEPKDIFLSLFVGLVLRVGPVEDDLDVQEAETFFGKG